MSNANWTVCNIKGDFEGLSQRHRISKRLARIMVNRGIDTDEAVRRYLNGTLSDLYAPELLRDMDKAVAILKKTLTAGEKLFIIGDYDIDGVCASYILKKGFRTICQKALSFEEDSLKEMIRVRLPDRQKDGYGMNRKMVEEAVSFGASLIVTCDNGIAACEEIRYAKERGLSVIVTDHHEVPFEEKEGEKQYILPPADAVIDPKRPDCSYPFEGICGGVVAYKLIASLFQAFSIEETALSELLCFAAFATVGDIMELTDENRIIVKYGLAEMGKGHNPGLHALIRATGLNPGGITPYHVGYVLGPCINATGRLDLADRALRLFEAEDENEAAVIAGELRTLNDSRKEMQLFYTEKAVSLLETDPTYQNEKVIVVYLPECHESLAGLIAGKLRERFEKPTIVLTDAAEGAKGSGRSIEAYDMYAELNKCRDLFTKFGGHKMAAGLSMAAEDIGTLRQRLNENTTLREQDLVKKFRADMQLDIKGATLDFVKELERLSPYGNGNPKPLFVEKNLRIVRMQVMGKNKNVLKLSVAPAALFEGDKLSDWSALHEAIYYGDAPALEAELSGKREIMLMFELAVNVYMGSENVQLVIRDYKV
ncbi:MAG: single-stranded-DNA-specific exonuclease RecJ [Lachnospiraceae bacterium]|nr:single-stranded-DNA-specific exonuclease RecJ [Lachnospiraceae bacterium]